LRIAFFSSRNPARLLAAVHQCRGLVPLLSDGSRRPVREWTSDHAAGVFGGTTCLNLRTRLESLDREVAAIIRDATEDRQRAACLAACEYAVQRSGFDAPLVHGILADLRSKRLPPPLLRVAVEKLADQFEDDYLTAQEEWEEESGAAGDPPTAIQENFERARAAAALAFSALPDACEAALEAVYEAAAATDEPKKLLTIVYHIIAQ